MSLVFILPIVFILSAALTYAFSKPTSMLYIVDLPNERSLHDIPKPRSGGLAIITGIYSGYLLCYIINPTVNYPLAGLMLSVTLVAIISFADDVRGVPFLYRLIVHIICATFIIWYGLALYEIKLPGSTVPLGVVTSTILSMLIIVWFINFYNFMDGMDGFASGMTIIGFTTMSFLGWMAGHDNFAIYSFIVAVANAGFLLFNYPPAKIFMGDVGSSSMGLLVIAFILWADIEDIFPFWIGVIIFSPFIVDSTVTLIKRILRGDKFWEAHKTHYYQRVVESGWGQIRTVNTEYSVMVICCIMAVILNNASPNVQLFGIGIITLMYAIFAYFLEKKLNI